MVNRLLPAPALPRTTLAPPAQAPIMWTALRLGPGTAMAPTEGLMFPVRRQNLSTANAPILQTAVVTPPHPLRRIASLALVLLQLFLAQVHGLGRVTD